jgi:hypothetical protein
MFSLNIVVPILICAIYLLQLFVDYKWHNKRTKKHKIIRRILIAVIIIFGGISIYTSTIQENSSQKLAQNLDDLKKYSEKSISDSDTREKKAQSEREEIKSLLKPFIEIAQNKYPSLDTNSALNRLLLDIKEVKELATRDIYKPLSASSKLSLISSIKEYITKSKVKPPALKFIVQQGNQNRYQVTLDLIEIFKAAKIDANIEAMGLFPQNAPEYGVEIHANSNYEYYIKGLFSTIRNYYDINFGLAIRDSKEWKKEGDFPNGEVHIAIFGTPLFAQNGKVSL